MSQIEEQCGCGAAITLPSTHTNVLTEWRADHQHEPPLQEDQLTLILESLMELSGVVKATAVAVAMTDPPRHVL